MELKDAILSTLAELEDNHIVEPKLESQPQKPTYQQSSVTTTVTEPTSISSDEKQFLQNIQERLLVLFEGFQSPNNTKIEAKVDLTLNFLEYLLASIENRLDILENKEKR